LLMGVQLHGSVAKIAEEAGIKGINVSFSHCDSSVIAVALAMR